MSELYIRKTQLIAGSRKFSADDLTIYFSVPFDDGPEINLAEVQIYNLSDSTIAELKKGDKVVLDAGYKDDSGSILEGATQLIYTEWSGVDRITELTIADAHDNWMRKEIDKTYKENITALQILNDLIPHTGLKVGALKLPLNMKYESGKTVEGIIGRTIVEIAKDCNAKVHVNKGKIFIREKSEGDKIAFVLDKRHGLIGSPTPIEKEETYNVLGKKKVVKTVKKKKVTTYVDEYTEKTRVKKGYKVVSLMNYNFTTDVIIKIVSRTANGYFRIESGSHESGGSNYYTEMEVFPV